MPQIMEEIGELIVECSATDHGGTRGSFQRVQGAAVYGGLFGELSVGWGFVHFSRSSRSSGVERQFSEPSMAKSSLPSMGSSTMNFSDEWTYTC